MKLLICTRADDGIAEMCKLSLPVIKAYATRVGAEFAVMDSQDWDVSRHYRIMELRELLQSYDRICHIDADTLIMPNCPDIFERVDAGAVGSIREDVGSRQNKRWQRMAAVQKSFGYAEWIQGYPNTGVFVVSRCHREMFEAVGGLLWASSGYDDVHLGYQMARLEYPVHWLHWKWNHMTMFSEPWNQHADRFKSFVIHYAGQGMFERRAKNRLHQMRLDYGRVYP